MPYPPPTLPINRTNALQQVDTHPADHNAVNGAVNDLRDHAVAQDSVVAGHSASLDAIQANAVTVTTDANGGAGFNLNRASSAPALALTQSSTTPAMLDVVLTIYGFTAPQLVSFIARHGNGTPVADSGLTVHWIAVG